MYHNLQKAGMEQAQAEVVATHIPDWSQFATKQDLESGLEKLRHDIMWPPHLAHDHRHGRARQSAGA